MNLPTKPIESIYIGVAGNPAVGIPRTSFRMEVFIDPVSLDDVAVELASIRKAVGDLYETLCCDEPVTVRFDYEVAKAK